jgi:hypothetical protein
MEARRGVSRTPRSVACRRNLPRSRQSQSAFQGHPSYECAGRVFPPMAMRPKIGDIERQPDIPTVMLLKLGNASINVIDFEVAQPVGGSLSGTIPPMSKMPAAALPRLCRSSRCGSGVALVCRRMSADGRGIERLGRLDITHIELIPDETSVSHSFLRVAGEQAVVMRTSLWRRPLPSRPGRDRGTARATLGKGLAVSAFPLDSIGSGHLRVCRTQPIIDDPRLP